MSRIAKAAGVALGTGAVVIGGAGLALADAGADAAAIGSPGVLSGNVVQVPIHIPVNVCGNTVNVIGLLNPAFGNTCANISGGDSHKGNPGPGGHGGYGG
jgi:hypothetical protein